jgi:excisionase family DNA binding protein
MNKPQTLSDELTLFTSAEIADILKMHPQVIARKLQAGEIEGFKLGKDWRVSKVQLLRFLEGRSNQKTAKTPADKIIQTFFEDGKLKALPVARSKRIHVLKHLVSMLDAGRVYTEVEINNFLRPIHADISTIRREFIMNKLMVRNSGKYKVTSWSQDE